MDLLNLLLQNSLVSAGLLSGAALIVLILRAHTIRAYPLLFVYAVLQFGATIAETLLWYQAGRGSLGYKVVYWTDEMLLDTLLFLTVITLTHKALAGKPNQAATGRLLSVIVAVVLVLPFALFYQRGIFSNAWFTGAGQVLHFGAAIMNLALWTALIGKKPRDSQLLTVSAGVGLAATGGALFYGVYQFTSGELRAFAGIMLSTTQVLSILICCWAFWTRKSEPSTASGY
jgi:hypothetical protein